MNDEERTVSWHSKLLTILLGVIIFGSGLYAGTEWVKIKVSLRDLEPVTEVGEISTSTVAGSPEKLTPVRVSTTTQNILNDFKKLNSKVLISAGWQAPKVPYAGYLINNGSFYQQPFGEIGGQILAPQDLVLVNLDTGERTIFYVYDQLANPDLIAFIKDIPRDVTYNVYADLLRISGRTLWGEIEIFGMADPPINIRVGYFTLDLDTGQIKTYALPDRGLLASANLNPNSGKILYESLDNGLSLYEYNIHTASDTLIVNYSQDVYDAHCSHFVSYVYSTTDFYGNCGIKHNLKPTWSTDGGVAYFDFVTQERIIVKTPQLLPVE